MDNLQVVLRYAVTGEVAQAWHIGVLATALAKGWEPPIRPVQMEASLEGESSLASDINDAVRYLVGVDLVHYTLDEEPDNEQTA